MFTRLVESERVRERHGAARVASVAAHASVIAWLAHATLGAAISGPSATLPAQLVFTVPTHAPVHGSPGPRSPCVDCSWWRFAAPIITSPTIDTPNDPGLDPLPIGAGSDAIFAGVRTVDRTPRDAGVDPSDATDLPATPRAGNPLPVYRAMLRSARVMGTVIAVFVVDTLGLVEPSSIAFASGSDALFEGSVRRALLASRFLPASHLGRPVRMLVRQEFTFRLTP